MKKYSNAIFVVFLIIFAAGLWLFNSNITRVPLLSDDNFYFVKAKVVEVVEDAGSIQVLEGHFRHDLSDLLQRAGAAWERDKSIAQLDHFGFALGHVLCDDQLRQAVQLVAFINEKLRFYANHGTAGGHYAAGQHTHQAAGRAAVNQRVAAFADPLPQLGHGSLQGGVCAIIGA